MSRPPLFPSMRPPNAGTQTLVTRMRDVNIAGYLNDQERQRAAYRFANTPPPSNMAGAERLFADGDYAAAAALLERLVRQNARDARAHFLLGLCQLRSRDARAAETSFRTAVRLQPRDHLAHYYLGLALERSRRSEDAQVEFRRALELKPDFAHARAKLAPPHVRASRAVTARGGMQKPTKPATWKVRRWGHAEVVGTARHVRIGAPAVGRGYRFTVLSFRVHRQLAGSEPQSIQVQWDGYTLVGMIEEGDRVQVRGPVRDGRIEPVAIRNLTTNSDVKVERFRAAGKVAAALATALIWVGGFALLIAALAGN